MPNMIPPVYIDRINAIISPDCNTPAAAQLDPEMVIDNADI